MKHNIIIIKPKLNGQSMTIIIDGVTYNSFNDLHFRTAVSDSLVRKYKKEMNLSLKEAIDYILCKAEQKENDRKSRLLKDEEKQSRYVKLHEFIYKGVTYPSFAYAIRKLNKDDYALSEQYISTIARKKNITKQEAIDLFLERRKLRYEKEKISEALLSEE